MTNSLSGRFLILTVVFVMLAEVFIFVPSVARFREDYLLARLERAQIASLALEADDMISPALEVELLRNAEVYNVVLRRNEIRQLALSSPIPSPITATYDMRNPSSTTLIADRLGIRQGSLYYYFKSKQQALAEVCLMAIRDYADRLAGIAALRQPFPAKLLAVFHSHLSSFRENRDAMKVYLDERLYLPDESRRDLHAIGSAYRQQLETLFADGVRDGELRGDLDPHFAALTVIGLGNAWGDLLLRDDTLDASALSSQCVELFMRGVVRNDD